MVKRPEEYIDMLAEKYPDIPRKTLLKIVDKGLRATQHLLYADLDVRIGNDHPGLNYRLSIVRPQSTWDAVMTRAKNKFYQLQRRRNKKRNATNGTEHIS